MSNPGIWLVAWLLISPIVALLILSNLGSIEGTKGRNKHRDGSTDHRPEADRINRPDVNRSGDYRADVNRTSGFQTDADRMSELGRTGEYRPDAGRTDVDRDFNQSR